MWIFRYIFLITIVTGSTSIGFLLSRSYIDRLKELKSLLNLVNIFQNKLKFTHKPLIEIFEETAIVSKDTRISDIFLKTSENLKKMKVEDAWKIAVTDESFFLNFKKDDIEMIKSFGNMLGKTDIDGQISEINQFINILNGQIVIAEEEKNKNSKLYKSLGTIVRFRNCNHIILIPHLGTVLKWGGKENEC